MSAKKSTAMMNLQARADAVQAAAAAGGQSEPANAKNFYQSDMLNVISSSPICSITP
jgi:hypothetical protein